MKKCKVDASFDTEKNDFGINKITIIIGTKNKEKSSNMVNIKDVEIIDIHIGNEVVENSEENNSKDIEFLKTYLSEHNEIDKNIININ